MESHPKRDRYLHLCSGQLIMTESEYDLLDDITGSFPGRAQRDDWAGQAKKFDGNS